MAICSDVTCEVEIIAGVHFYLVNEVMFSLRLFVCLFVSRITQTLLNRFSRNSV